MLQIVHIEAMLTEFFCPHISAKGTAYIQDIETLGL